MKRILCLFDYVARTGYGTVSKNMVYELRKHFKGNLQLDIIGINYFGEPFYEDENVYVNPITIDEQKDSYGRYAMMKKVKTESYDGVFILLDLGQITPILEILQHLRKEKKEHNLKNFKIIYYFPVDCILLVPELCKNLEVCDLIVTYTDFAKKEILRHKPELLSKIKIIPHGNNSKDFYPLPENEKKEFRKQFFGENADKFIIVNVNRNQPRKDIPTTIFAFIEAKKNWVGEKEPFLYLHCHPQDPMGWDLRVVMMQTGLVEDKDYKLLPKQYEEEMTDIPTLNAIYNSCDAYISTTLGEGWGLSFSEAASCKLPIIAPYSTSFMEMSGYGRNAFMIKTLHPFCNTDCIIREQCDYVETAEIIQEVGKLHFENSPILKNKIENSYQWVKKLEWNIVCKDWVEYFKQVYGAKTA